MGKSCNGKNNMQLTVYLGLGRKINNYNVGHHGLLYFYHVVKKIIERSIYTINLNNLFCMFPHISENYMVLFIQNEQAKMCHYLNVSIIALRLMPELLTD